MTTIDFFKTSYFNCSGVYTICVEEAPAPYIWRPEDKLCGVCALCLSMGSRDEAHQPHGAVFYLLSHLACPVCVLSDDTEV